MRRPGWIVYAALVAGAGGFAASADELVTRDGQVIETRGPWQVRGKLLVFELADGTLASLRLEEADLEASERRAAEKARRARRAREEALRPPPEPKEAVVVLTDRDVAHARPGLGEDPAPEEPFFGELESDRAFAGDPVAEDAAGGSTDAEGGDGDAVAGGAVASSDRGVQVVQWSQEAEGEDGLAVKGVIQNLGSSFATSLSVNALFYDEAGALVAAREVQFEEGPLAPGARRNFSVSLPHSLIYDEIKFQVVGRGFRSVGQSVRAAAGQAPPGVEETP